MSRTFRGGERRVRLRAVKRKTPDYRKLARALIELAQAQAEAEAQADHTKRTAPPTGKQDREARR